MGQRLGGKAAAINAKVATVIRLLVVKHNFIK
jgi:hypothetical protein